MFLATLFGMIVGAGLALWHLPMSGKRLRRGAFNAAQDASRALQNRVQPRLPTDPVAESIAQGKAAARRRLDDLGLRGG